LAEKENSKMKRIAMASAALTGLLLALGALANAQIFPILTVNNQAGSPTSVRVVGPTSGYLDVPASASRTVAVSGGAYRLKVRYCDGGGSCRYSETDPFVVTQTSNSVSDITVTLHSTGGNLHERGISESEFTTHPSRSICSVPPQTQGNRLTAGRSGQRAMRVSTNQ
jgi:hypothetical protein